MPKALDRPEDVRNVVLRVRFTVREIEAMRENAVRAGIPVATFVHRALSEAGAMRSPRGRRRAPRGRSAKGTTVKT